MRRAAVVLLTAVLMLVLPRVGAAQSLAELAAKEKARRKKSEAPATTYTEQDLGRSRRPSGAFPSSSGTPSETTPSAGSEAAKEEGSAAAGSPKEAEKTEEELLAERQTAWRDKLKQAQEYRDKLAASTQEIETSLGSMGAQPYGSARARTLAQLEETKGKLADVEREIEALQDEGRRNRYRP
jgi:hypothetical protein